MIDLERFILILIDLERFYYRVRWLFIYICLSLVSPSVSAPYDPAVAAPRAVLPNNQSLVSMALESIYTTTTFAFTYHITFLSSPFISFIYFLLLFRDF